MKNPLPYLMLPVWLCGACSTSADQTPASPAAPQQTQTQTKMPEGKNINSDAKLMADFTAKVDDYVKLRNGLADKAPPIKQTSDPQVLLGSQKALAAQVRAARTDAKRGDFFTPATQAQFRRLLTPSTKGPEGTENKNAIRDDAPEQADVPFKVNADYPRDESLSTVPPDVLLALPKLPKDIEYRFVDRHLLLYDAKANMIIDFMLNATPPMPPKKR